MQRCQADIMLVEGHQDRIQWIWPLSGNHCWMSQSWTLHNSFLWLAFKKIFSAGLNSPSWIFKSKTSVWHCYYICLGLVEKWRSWRKDGSRRMEMVTQEIFVFLALFLYFGIHSTPMDVNMAYSSLDNVQTFLGFPVGSASKESACNAGDLGSSPGLGRSAGEGNSYPLQYSGLKILFFKMKLKKIKEKNVRACIYECGCIDGQTPNRAPLMMHNLYCQDQGCWNSVCLQPYYRVSVKFQGMYSPWGHKKSDTTEQLSLSLQSSVSLDSTLKNTILR